MSRPMSEYHDHANCNCELRDSPGRQARSLCILQKLLMPQARSGTPPTHCPILALSLVHIRNHMKHFWPQRLKTLGDSGNLLQSCAGSGLCSFLNGFPFCAFSSCAHLQNQICGIWLRGCPSSPIWVLWQLPAGAKHRSPAVCEHMSQELQSWQDVQTHPVLLSNKIRHIPCQLGFALVCIERLTLGCSAGQTETLGVSSKPNCAQGSATSDACCRFSNTRNCK